MLINENVHRVNGIPLYYNALGPFVHHASSLYDYHTLSTPYASPPYTKYDFLMSKITSQNSPLTLTPPISPLPVKQQESRRGSVIMKVENCQIVPVIDVDLNEHVCRWTNCYRWEFWLFKKPWSSLTSRLTLYKKKNNFRYDFFWNNFIFLQPLFK